MSGGTLKQFVGCLVSVFEHHVGLAFKWLNWKLKNKKYERLIYFYIDLTTIFKIRHFIMGECLEDDFAINLFHALEISH